MVCLSVCMCVSFYLFSFYLHLAELCLYGCVLGCWLGLWESYDRVYCLSNVFVCMCFICVSQMETGRFPSWMDGDKWFSTVICHTFHVPCTFNAKEWMNTSLIYGFTPLWWWFAFLSYHILSVWTECVCVCALYVQKV